MPLSVQNLAMNGVFKPTVMSRSEVVHAATVTICDSRANFDAYPCYGYSTAGEPFGTYPSCGYSASVGSPFGACPCRPFRDGIAADYFTVVVLGYRDLILQVH